MKLKTKELRNLVLDLFRQHPTALFNHKQIKSRLGIDIKAADLINALEELVKEEKLAEMERGRFHLVNQMDEITGTISFTAAGNAFVIPQETGKSDDIFVDEKDARNALDGDLVVVRVFNRKRKSKRPEGEVIEVLERKRTELPGILEIQDGKLMLIPDSRKIKMMFRVTDAASWKKEAGNKAVGRMLEWNDPDLMPEVEIIKILGEPGDNDAEMHSIAAEAGFMEEFPADVEREAEAIPVKITKEEISKREDFTKILTLTIDPFDAKDFDDALSFRVLEEGLFEVGVHIADVGHYIKENSLLDKEADRRATSVYLVDRTFPMLPEKLSNGVCSLRPQEEKLTFSVIFNIDIKGQIKDSRLVKTVIFSDRRYTYEEAQEVLESGESTDELSHALHTMNTIAKNLKEARFRKGAMNFETEEVKFKLDENGKPIELVKKVRKDAHKLIEEFMLLANKEVALYAEKIKKERKGAIFVYRVHDEPNMEKILDFSIFAKRLGYTVNTADKNAIASSMNKLMEQAEGKPEQNILQSMAIRSMAKAFYTTKNIGHYGLAFSHYSHFTSPIRRYPDLMAHRLLFKYLQGENERNEEFYEKKCRHSSMQEVKAAEAERSSIKYKQAEFMLQYIGRVFPGMITGVTEWGIYVEVTETKCEGLVRLSSMFDDYYTFIEKEQAVIGKRFKKKYRIGDMVRVKVKSASPQKMTIDYTLI